jgi:hypothetical protein
MSVAGGSTSNVSLMSMGIASGCAFCRVNVWGGRAGWGGDDVGLLSRKKEEAKEVVKEEVKEVVKGKTMKRTKSRWGRVGGML